MNQEARTLSGVRYYALAFGLFLGLSLVKFGNPVILEQAIPAPLSLREAWYYPWPVGWSRWCLGPLILAGLALATARRPPGGTGDRSPAVARWLWLLPVIWFGWQLVSATRTVDIHLTLSTLWQFGGCVACYFAGAWLPGGRRSLHWLLIGLLAGFLFCLVRAVNQRMFEFPQERRMLLEGQRTGWTNFAPEAFARLKRENVIVATNGVDVANPFIVAKYEKGRVNGTLVYPNALAGALLLLGPASIAVAFGFTRHFKPGTRTLVVAFTMALVGASFFWTGSKLAWLIAVAMVCGWLVRLNRGWRWKAAALAGVLLAGAVVFGVRFHSYFAGGARSAGARLDYWGAAVRGVQLHPWTGTGPGTFQRLYSTLKSPEAEMARLAHNDFLEQFCDSGMVAGLSYLGWIALGLAGAGRRLWRAGDALAFGVLIGICGWFAQGVGEFSLYIPGLAWPAFTLLGWAAANRIDKAQGPD